MNENIKLTAKIITKASFSFLKINILGQFLNLGIIFTNFYILKSKISHSDNSNTFLNTIGLIFKENPIISSLLVISLILTPILIFTLGNKYIISKVIHLFVNHKGEVLLNPVIDKVFSKIKNNKPHLIEKGADKIKLRLKMLQEIKNSSESKWTKMTLSYLLNKINLDEAERNNEDISITDTIKNLIHKTILEISEPSRLFYWIILLVNISIGIVIII